jgi:outer membrane protein
MRRFGLIGVLLAAVTVLVVACGEDKQTAEGSIVFMDNFKVFEEFEMKKDYDAMLEQQLGTEQSKLDSLSTILNGLKDPLEIAKQKKTLFEAQQVFDQRFGGLSDKYTQEVYQRLNKYIQAYGKQNGYRMIMGSNGQGSVMYVDTTANVTADLIKYINKEYTK